ncbi:MAG: hypothetical protein IPM96_19730 [Ignavibacteria bacterium]|nr:hypothetical protein [Ignavibacteria bacterium]
MHLSQWTVISTVPTAPLINSISVVNQNLIWIACDGGKSIQGALTAVLTGVCAIPDFRQGMSTEFLRLTSNCWVGNVSGSIYRTSNGGASWVQQLAVANSFSDGIHMFQ